VTQFSDDQSSRTAGLARYGVGATPGSDAVDQEGAARWLLEHLAGGAVPEWLRTQLDGGQAPGSGEERAAAVDLLARKVRWLALYGLLPSVSFPRLAIFTATLQERMAPGRPLPDGTTLEEAIRMPLAELEQVLIRWRSRNTPKAG
jgi:hypothetical protein